MKAKILFIDDEQNILDAFKRQLRGRFDMDTANSGQKGLDLLESEGPYAVVVSDMRMPEMDGVGFLSQVQKKSPDTIRLMLTGNADQETAVKALNEGGVIQFLNKPCSEKVLNQALQDAVQQYHLARAEKKLLAKTLNGSIRILTDILSMADPEGFSQSQSLKKCIKSFAPMFKGTNSWEVELAAMLSSIGNVTLPSETMTKSRAKIALTGVEKDMLVRIPEIGSRLIKSIPRLGNVARIILYQNKLFDGSGFPQDSVSGLEIPEGSRKIKIFSDLIHLESKGLSRGLALEKMKSLKGRYDEAILDCVIVFSKDSDESVVEEKRAIDFAELKEGNLLASDVKSTDGMCLAMAGSEISQLLLEKLENFNCMVGLKEPIYIKSFVEKQ